MIGFLQINVGVSPLAQNFMVETAKEYECDIILVSEQCRNGGEEYGWYNDQSHRAAIYVTKEVAIEAVGPPESGFRWLQIGGIRVYSVYWSPTVTLASYADFLERLEASVRSSLVPVIVAGDFNAKSPEWCSPITDTRGVMLVEMASSLGLQVCNDGGPTFVRANQRTYIDVTLASEIIARKITNWRVLNGVNSASYHKYIVFTMVSTRPRTQQTGLNSGWNWRKLDKEALEEYIRSTPIIRVESDRVEDLYNSLDCYMSDACSQSMPRRVYHGNKKPAYWWTEEIAALRKSSFAARRKYQRARERRGADDCREEQRRAREALKALRVAVRKSQARAWDRLCELVDSDPWGLPYRLVTGKLLGRRPIPELTAPGRLEHIVTGLFPPCPAVEWQIPVHTGAMLSVAPVTPDEVRALARSLPTGKAPGPDCVPDAVVRVVALARAEEVAYVFTKCLEMGVFPVEWKRARLMLIRKPGKPLDQPSSYRPLSLINTTAKLFERVIKGRLEVHLNSIPEGLSDRQYGFRKGRSTIDAIEDVRNVVQRVGTGPLAARDLCVLVAIDVANAFNSAPWHRIGGALLAKGVPSYLVNIIRDYLNNRCLITEIGDVAISCGVPQGSVIGPLLWNIFYDGLLELPLPVGVRLVGFADDLAVLGTAHTTELLEMAVNPALVMVAEWMAENGLSVSVAKTKAIMLTSKRGYRRPGLILQGTQLALSDHIRYLGVELSSNLGFRRHIQVASDRASKTTAALSRLLPNVGGPTQAKRKLLASVVNSQLLYASPVWCSSLVFQNHRNTILGPQRRMALRVARAYRTVSTAAILVIASCTPVHLIARGRGEARRLAESGVAPPVAMRIVDELVWSWWQAEWSEEEGVGQWTKRLIPSVRSWVNRRHGSISYHLAQLLTGHGCFQQYLFRFARVTGPECVSCGQPSDCAEHTFFDCDRWYARRRALEVSVDCEITPETIVEAMLKSSSNWKLIEDYVTEILKMKEDEERVRQGVII